eukprot:CAMPEP_0183710760 /NCGR_PEP_ID=MMETSP0737-20130205/6418_1 /TAXON_ID=385413 /ORGANISM="Thalassiosira miniscula, Strain CCMP1093" /LENGTH=160 /DNA_ID=CAMNT_0025939095 /DNA_START=128 /DNA_END=610 /DNA_ORIENTATION=+
MEESFSSPKPSYSKKSLTCPCPPLPPGHKRSVTFDSENNPEVPDFFPISWSIISTNSSNAVETNGEPADTSRSTADFALESGLYNSQVASTRKSTIKDFPALPHLSPAPTNESPSFFHLLPMRIPSSSPNLVKLPLAKRRRKSLVRADITDAAFDERHAR